MAFTGYQPVGPEVSGDAGTPHPAPAPVARPMIAVPFTPPDTSQLGPGPAAGGTMNHGGIPGNHGGHLAELITHGIEALAEDV
jgi:hypothetical protein